MEFQRARFESLMRILDDSFVTLDHANNELVATISNPGLRDFLEDEIASDDLASTLGSSPLYFEQLAYLWQIAERADGIKLKGHLAARLEGVENVRSLLRHESARFLGTQASGTIGRMAVRGLLMSRIIFLVRSMPQVGDRSAIAHVVREALDDVQEFCLAGGGDVREVIVLWRALGSLPDVFPASEWMPGVRSRVLEGAAFDTDGWLAVHDFLQNDLADASGAEWDSAADSIESAILEFLDVSDGERIYGHSIDAFVDVADSFGVSVNPDVLARVRSLADAQEEAQQWRDDQDADESEDVSRAPYASVGRQLDMLFDRGSDGDG